MAPQQTRSFWVYGRTRTHLFTQKAISWFFCFIQIHTKADGFLSFHIVLIIIKTLNKIRFYKYFLFAASTTWPTSTEVVTLPTPPGTGVMASTIGSTSAKATSPQSLPSSFTLIPTSITVCPGDTYSLPTTPARPAATMRISASRVTLGISLVLV